MVRVTKLLEKEHALRLKPHPVLAMSFATLMRLKKLILKEKELLQPKQNIAIAKILHLEHWMQPKWIILINLIVPILL